MSRRRRHKLRLFGKESQREAISLAGSADYWPLTVTPSTKRPKPSLSAWIVAGAVAAVGASLVFAVQRGIPAW